MRFLLIRLTQELQTVEVSEFVDSGLWFRVTGYFVNVGESQM